MTDEAALKETLVAFDNECQEALDHVVKVASPSCYLTLVLFDPGVEVGRVVFNSTLESDLMIYRTFEHVGAVVAAENRTYTVADGPHSLDQMESEIFHELGVQGATIPHTSTFKGLVELVSRRVAKRHGFCVIAGVYKFCMFAASVNRPSTKVLMEGLCQAMAGDGRNKPTVVERALNTSAN